MDAAVSRLKPFIWPLAIVILAAAVYIVRIQKEMVDFAVYRRAADRAMTGEPLYRESDGHYRYKYLPAFAFAMAPFAKLDPEAAKVIWFALSVGLLSAFVRWSVRSLPERRRSEKALIWFAILFMGKFYAHELALGQTNILLGTLLMGALLSSQIDQPVLAGTLVALGIFVKPYAVILLPWLALAGGLAGVAVALIVLAIGLGLPAFVYGWTGNLHQIAGWYYTVTESTPSTLLIPENVSYATMWSKWLGAGATATRLAVVTGVVSLGLAAATMARRRNVSEPNYLEFGLLMLLVPVLSPQGWDYVLLLATPAVICLIDRLGDMSRPWRWLTLTALIVMSFSIFDLVGRAIYTRLMAISIISVCVLALVVSLVQLRLKRLA
jgi:hypothetical protein